MPNHVYTTMSIEGTKEEVANFFEKHFTSDNDDGGLRFDLETFSPMPEELQGTVSPNNPPRVDGREVSLISPEYKAWVARSKRLVEAHGADNWYDWHLQNWGTKWNTYDNDIQDNVVSFQTAWSLPDPIFAKMAEMYPLMTFNIECVEEGGFFAGTILISEGKVKENLTNDIEKWKEYARVQMPWCFEDEE